MPIPILRPSTYRGPPHLGTMTWANLPPASTLPNGTRATITGWNAPDSDWVVRGGYWLPVGGRATMLNWAGNNAVALTSGTFAQVAGMPTPVMPAGFVATPGAYVRNVLKAFRKVAAGANDQVGAIRISANVVDINTRHYGGLNFTSSAATSMYTLDMLTAVNVIGGYFTPLATTAGAVPAEATVAAALNTALDNQPIIVSARGVSAAGLDTLYFDSWLIELYA